MLRPFTLSDVRRWLLPVPTSSKRAPDRLDQASVGSASRERERDVLADADRAIGPLFGPPPADVTPGLHTRRLAVTAVGVAGIPGWLVNHGLWRVADLLGVVLESEEETSQR